MRSVWPKIRIDRLNSLLFQFLEAKDIRSILFWPTIDRHINSIMRPVCLFIPSAEYKKSWDS